MPPQTADRLPPGQTQHTIFQADVVQGTEDGERLVRIEGCQVVNPPVVSEWIEKKQKKKAWVSHLSRLRICGTRNGQTGYRQ